MNDESISDDNNWFGRVRPDRSLLSLSSSRDRVRVVKAGGGSGDVGGVTRGSPPRVEEGALGSKPN